MTNGWTQSATSLHNPTLETVGTIHRPEDK
jgi:hypothetical protein